MKIKNDSVKLTKIEKLYCLASNHARGLVESRKKYGGEWSMGTSFLDESETLNADRQLLKKVLHEIEMLKLDAKFGIMSPEKIADKTEKLGYMKTYFERRIEISNPKNW